jgi:glycosyltransferase involved in cell wall biosynthesis
MSGKSTRHFLSLIVPSYKQEKTIEQNLQQLKKVLDRIRYDYEIIVVIDGEVDHTLQVLKKAKIQKVTIITYRENQGKSFAIRTGMQHANGDYCMFIDAGMEIDPNGISMLLEHMEWYNADIIVGSKRHPASIIRYSSIRKVLSYGYYYFVRLLYGITIHDTQAGIKVFRKKVLEKILPRLLEKKFAGDLEMLVVAKYLGFERIYEAPIKLDYTLQKLTSAATLRSIIGIFLDTLAIFYRTYLIKYYDNPHNKYVEPQDLNIYTPT